jgi:MFS family permease
MQQVLFAWLVVGELRAEARWVGVAQSATMLPSFALILLGGAIADRRDRRAMLIGLHLLATALSLVLLGSVAAGWLSLGLLIAYALGMGTISAFTVPARDSLLSEVAGANLMRAVTTMTLMQWTAQAVGSMIAGSARWIGTVPALGLHALTIFGGVPALSRLAPAPPRDGRPQNALRLADLGVGVLEVVRSPHLRPVLLMVAAVGVLFMGPMLVVYPLLVRDYYAGDVGQLGVLQMAFPIGTILGSLGILTRGGIRRKGLAQLVALVAGAFCLGAVGLGLPFWGTFVATVLWGVAASVFMNSGRTIFQEKAPPSQRGRVLSVYSLGFMGASGLVGAPAAGVMIDVIGPLSACLLDSALMFGVAGAVAALTQIRHVE